MAINAFMERKCDFKVMSILPNPRRVERKHQRSSHCARVASKGIDGRPIATTLPSRTLVLQELELATFIAITSPEQRACFSRWIWQRANTCQNSLPGVIMNG